MITSTNLALRPFRNERMPWLMALLLMASAVLVSVAHGRLIGRLLSGDEANTVRAVREDEERIALLEANIAKEPPLKVEASELARLRAIKDLVDRRAFPWRRLLAELEGTLSEDVRLTRITPSPSKDLRGMVVQLVGEARSKDAAFSLAEALDASPAFSNAVLSSLAEVETVLEFTVQVEFDPDFKRGVPAAEALASTGGASLPPSLPEPKPVSGRTP